MLVLAVDDEPLGLSELTHALEQQPQVRRVLTATDSADALRIIGGSDPEVAARRAGKQAAVDAVFADITMPGLSGVELARVFNALTPPPALVFVTGGDDHAVTAFELGALDYLLKPITSAKLNRTMKRVAANRALAALADDRSQPAQADTGDDEVIPVELAGTTKMISRSTVRWVEALGDYARLHTADGGSHLVRIPLAQLEERWSGAGFVRIHRSYLVALSLITELRMGASGYTVMIGDNEKELPVSRRHTRHLKDRLVRPPGWDTGD
ncbi:MAG: LytR/AlgR family response regulator transcription factor [Sciscionella sp.]